MLLYIIFSHLLSLLQALQVEFVLPSSVFHHLDAICTLWLVIVSFVNVGMASKWVNDLGKGDFGS